MKLFLQRFFLFAAVVCCLCLPSVGYSRVRIAVIYPQVDQPYAKVFEQIIADIRLQKGFEVQTYTLSDNYDPGTVSQWIRKQNAQTLVALGQRGVDIVESLNMDIPIIVGAVLYASVSQNNLVSGISLTPDPDLLFKHLKQLAPGIKRVHVVYNPDRYQWLIDYAKKAASRRGVTIVAREARDLPSAAPMYRELLADSQQDNDAVWLLQDSTTVGNSSILPLVLKEAWEKKLVVFSSNPSHVRRGVLFSLYADQDAIGRSITQLLLHQTSGTSKSKGLLPLSDVRIAVNLRTAGHIKLDIPFEQRRQFDTVYPKR
ncbi:MAG: ABC transporter substrate-binding protein [Gammaproteobacteria bacterium]|nr:ABC transporter substrate-binding protein [Gammaproteobacteria bacterium]